MARSRRELARRIEQVAQITCSDERFKQLLSNTGWQFTTGAIKDVFVDLGRQLGYQVAASGSSNVDDAAWLYDVSWHGMSKDGLFDQLGMALKVGRESDGSITEDDVDWEFNKLIQARAEVRVWLSLVPNSGLTANHFDNWKMQIRAFLATQVGDTYLFIIYDWVTTNTLIELFVVDRATPALLSNCAAYSGLL